MQKTPKTTTINYQLINLKKNLDFELKYSIIKKYLNQAKWVKKLLDGAFCLLNKCHCYPDILENI